MKLRILALVATLVAVFAPASPAQAVSYWRGDAVVDCMAYQTTASFSSYSSIVDSQMPQYRTVLALQGTITPCNGQYITTDKVFGYLFFTDGYKSYDGVRVKYTKMSRSSPLDAGLVIANEQLPTVKAVCVATFYTEPTKCLSVNYIGPGNAQMAPIALEHPLIANARFQYSTLPKPAGIHGWPTCGTCMVP